MCIKVNCSKIVCKILALVKRSRWLRRGLRGSFVCIIGSVFSVELCVRNCWNVCGCYVNDCLCVVDCFCVCVCYYLSCCFCLILVLKSCCCCFLC